MAKPSLEQLVERGKSKASALGHDMELVISDVRSAFFRCTHCQQTFTVGYPVYIGSRPQETRLELIAASVLSAPCAGQPAWEGPGSAALVMV